MSTKYIASNWRLPNEENSGKSDNYGLSFDGSEYIDLDIQSLTTPATISIWVNTAVNDSQQRYAIINGRADQTPYLYLRMATDNTYQVLFFNSNGSDTLQGSSATINTWFHFVIVCENSQTLLYENGVLKDTSTTGWNGVNIDQSNNWQIGRDSRGQRFWSGSISECAFFDYALSSTQISTLYGSSSLGAGNPMALKPQPVAYYPLGDNSASNPLTQPNEAVEDASVFDFNPTSNQYINCGNILDQSGTDAFSISSWFYLNSTKSNTIVSKMNSSFVGYQLYVNAANKLKFLLQGTGNLSATGSTVLSLNTWYNVILTYDGSGTTGGINLFLNGATESFTGSGSNSGGVSNSENFEIGARTGAVDEMDGLISNVAFWNSDQSSEISNIYNSGVPATTYTNTPTAWYKLDQSANWEADTSGAWQIPDAVSAYPQSFDFDGSSNYITVNNSSGQLNYDNITVSGWINPNATGTRGAIVSNTALGSGYHSYSFSHWLDNTMCLIISTSTNNQVFSTHTLNINEWNHVAFTWDGTTAKIYVNNQVTTPTVSSGNISNYSTNDVEIGKRTGASHYINGEMSNIQIFNSALPETGTDSVETLYNNGVPLTTAIASDNLKLWAKLDNTATFSTNWSIPDASGNGNTGTSSGMTEQNLVNNNVSALNGESSGMTSANLVLSDLTRAVPYDSYSFKFDAASSDAFILPTSTFVFANEFSLSVWVNPSTFSTSQVIFGNGLSSKNWLRLSSTTTITFKIDTSRTFTESSGNNLVANTWQHLLITRDASNIVTIYRNGVIFGVSTANSGTYINSTIGYRGSSYFDGKLSNISLFNEALTSTEVLKLYANGVPQDLTNFTPAPVAWYPLGSNSFWNGSQWTVRDMIGSNDGTGQNIGVDGLVGDAPRSEANGTGSNMDIESNITGSTKWSSNNSWSINMSSEARKEDTP